MQARIDTRPERSALQRPTLILNRNWQPVNVAPVARALVLLWNDHARVVDPADYQTYDWADWAQMTPDKDELFVQAVTCRLRVPEVITLTQYNRLPSGSVAFCLLYTSPSPRDATLSRMPSSA